MLVRAQGRSTLPMLEKIVAPRTGSRRLERGRGGRLKAGIPHAGGDKLGSGQAGTNTRNNLAGR